MSYKHLSIGVWNGYTWNPTTKEFTNDLNNIFKVTFTSFEMGFQDILKIYAGLHGGEIRTICMGPRGSYVVVNSKIGKRVFTFV